MISAILRVNVFEALLIGVPFVPVTQADRQAQERDKWVIPEPSRFVLANEKYGIKVFDRRNKELPQQVARGKEGRNVFHFKLAVPSDTSWDLTYYLPESMIHEAVSEHDRSFAILLGAVLAALFRAARASITKRVAEEELADLVTAPSVGGFSKRIQVERKTGSIRVLGQGVNALLDTSEKGLREIARVFNALSKGDLTQHMDNEYSGIFGQVKNDCNRTVGNLRKLIGNMHRAALAVRAASEDISAGNGNLSKRTHEQAMSLETTAANMQAFAQTVKLNGNRAEDANQIALAASSYAQRGADTVDAVIATMQAMSESSRKIAGIVEVIDNIALQTSILALNAEIEAARAVESGRGFAVVAGEVRNLAQRSGAATRSINQLISAALTGVEVYTVLINRSGQSMNEIVASGRQVTDIMGQIATASADQSAEIDQVNRAISEMDAVTQPNAGLVKDAGASAASLEAQANTLVELVSVFQLDESMRSAQKRSLGL